MFDIIFTLAVAFFTPTSNPEPTPAANDCSAPLCINQNADGSVTTGICSMNCAPWTDGTAQYCIDTATRHWECEPVGGVSCRWHCKEQ